MSTSKTRPSKEKVQEALDLLQEAAREEKANLSHLITDKYADLSSVLDDVRYKAKTRLEEEGDKLRGAREEGEEAIKEAAAHVDRYVRSDPWRVMSFVAAGAFLFGYLFGRDKR